MTAEELIHHLNHTFTNLDEPWPKMYEVDAETYANCCQYIFDNSDLIRVYSNKQELLHYWEHITLGLNRGIMFKNVELLLKKDNNK